METNSILYWIRRAFAFAPVKRMKSFVKNKWPEASIKPLRKGMGYALKFVITDNKTQYFAKVENPIDKLRRKGVSNSQTEMFTVRQEGEALSAANSIKRAPRVYVIENDFYIREFSAGSTLTAYIDKNLSSDRALVAEVITDAVKSLNQLSDLGIFHDGNPDNMIVDDRKVTLIDLEYTHNYKSIATRRLIHDLSIKFPSLQEDLKVI